MPSRPSLVFVAAVFAAATVSAQAPAPPAFEVVSIKQNTEPTGASGLTFSPSGRFGWNRMTLSTLLQNAYADVNPRQIIGLPDWARSARFDLAATSADALKEFGPGGEPLGLFLRLRAALEDRFALRTHVERREMDVYVLEAAATPFSPGPGLRRVDADCEAVTRAMAQGTAPPRPYGQLPQCALSASLGSLRGRAATLPQVADIVAGPAGRPVIVAPQLAGTFDVELQWAPQLPPGSLINGQPAPPSDGPSIFTAVREQLGLRLQPGRAPMPVLVVDAISMLTPD
jgi:uncharacterized protein (TIGR03435 family)